MHQVLPANRLHRQLPLFKGQSQIQRSSFEIVDRGGSPETPSQTCKAVGPLCGIPRLETLIYRRPNEALLLDGPQPDGLDGIFVGGVATLGELHEDIGGFPSGYVAQREGNFSTDLR